MKTTDTDTVYLTGLGKVIKAYEEIAATRMRVIRSGVVKNREFTGRLNQIFCLVKNSYIKETQKYQVQMLRQKNGRIARIFFPQTPVFMAISFREFLICMLLI